MPGFGRRDWGRVSACTLWGMVIFFCCTLWPFITFGNYCGQYAPFAPAFDWVLAGTARAQAWLSRSGWPFPFPPGSYLLWAPLWGAALAWSALSILRKGPQEGRLGPAPVLLLSGLVAVLLLGYHALCIGSLIRLPTGIHVGINVGVFVLPIVWCLTWAIDVARRERGA